MIDIKIVLNLIMFILFSALFLLIFLKGIDQRRSRVFNVFVFNMVLWSGGLAMFYYSHSHSTELFWAKFVYIAGGLIPPSFLYYSYIFDKEKKITAVKILSIFLPNFILFYLYFFTPHMISNIITIQGVKTFVYGPLHLLWEICFMIVFSFGFVRFLNLYKKVSGLDKEHIKYIFLGTFTGTVCASMTNIILPLIGIFNYVWLGPALASSWLLCITYTLLKHKLINVKMAITNTGIFIVIYALVLGTPFYLYYAQHQLLSLILMGVLATLGPFIFNYIKKKAEDRIQEEEKRYQNALILASQGLNTKKTKEDIVSLVSNILIKAMRLSDVSIYLKEGEMFKLVKPNESLHIEKEIGLAHPLIRCLRRQGTFLVHELESKFKMDIPEIEQSYKYLSATNADLVVPIIKDEGLQGMVILGKKINQVLYSSKDIVVLNIVADHMALALENARYMQEETSRMEHEGAASRRQHLDTMVSTMSHSIANPLNTAKIDLGYLEAIVEDHETLNIEDKEQLFKRIKSTQETLSHISEIIQSIRNYSKGQINYENLNINVLLKSFQPIRNSINIEYANTKYIEDVQDNLPEIYGDESMIKEVLAIYLNNAHQALKRNKELKTITMTVRKINDEFVRFEYQDNGYGIKDDVKVKLFETTYTTKTHGEGTGLGLWRVRKICDFMKAMYGFSSPGEGLGAKFWMDIKIAGVDNVKISTTNSIE